MNLPKSILVLVALLTGLASAESSEVLRLGLLGNKFDKPFATGLVGFAQERRAFEKAFEKDGVKVEWAFFKGGAPALNEAIANGKIDIAVYGDVGSIAGKGGGLPTRVIAPNGVGGGKSYILVSSSSNIHKPSDLKGKRISLSRGTAPQLLFYRWARDVAGLAEKDFRVVSLPSNDQDAAFASGSVDVLLGSNLEFVDRGLARILYTIDTDKEPRLAGFGNVVVTESYLKAHPDRVQAWVDAFVDVAAEVLDERNRADFVRVSTKNGTSAKNVRLTQPKDLVATNAPVFDEYYLTRLQSAIDDCRAFGIIPRDIPVSEWIVRDFLDKALARKGLTQAWGSLRDGRKAALEQVPGATTP